MFRHIVMWDYKEGFSPEENTKNAKAIKSALEGLKGIIPEIADIKVVINELGYSTKDILLDASFRDEAGFLIYKDHPDHKAAGQLTKDFLDGRVALDYID